MPAFAAALNGIASAAVAAIRAAVMATIALANLRRGHLFRCAPCYRPFPTAWVPHNRRSPHRLPRHRGIGMGAINPTAGERTADDESDGTRRPAGGGRRLPGGGIGDSASRTT